MNMILQKKQNYKWLNSEMTLVVSIKKKYSRDEMWTVICNSVRLSAYFQQNIKRSHEDIPVPSWIIRKYS